MVLSRTQTFLSEFNNVCKPRRNICGRLFSNTVRIELNEVNSHEYRLNWIYVQPKERGKGHASFALRWLCDLADAHNIRLSLSPANLMVRTGDMGMNTLQLTAWYQKFGFVRIGMQDEMMRYPNGKRM